MIEWGLPSLITIICKIRPSFNTQDFGVLYIEGLTRMFTCVVSVFTLIWSRYSHQSALRYRLAADEWTVLVSRVVEFKQDRDSCILSLLQIYDTVIKVFVIWVIHSNNLSIPLINSHLYPKQQLSYKGHIRQRLGLFFFYSSQEPSQRFPFTSPLTSSFPRHPYSSMSPTFYSFGESVITSLDTHVP